MQRAGLLDFEQVVCLGWFHVCLPPVTELHLQKPLTLIDPNSAPAGQVGRPDFVSMGQDILLESV